MQDLESFPINYNHYYTHTIHKRRTARDDTALETAIKSGIASEKVMCSCNRCSYKEVTISVEKIIQDLHKNANPNMEDVGCEDALDCLFAIYKVNLHFILSHRVPTPLRRRV